MMLTTLFIYGNANKKTYVNLANLARLRGDSDLAKNWLDKAITSDEVNADFDKAITNIEQILAQDNEMSPFTI